MINLLNQNIFPLIVGAWSVPVAAAPLQGTLLVLTLQNIWSRLPCGGRGCSWGAQWNAVGPGSLLLIFEHLIWLVTLELPGFGGKSFEPYVKGLELGRGYSVWYWNQKSLLETQPDVSTVLLPQVTCQKHYPFLFYAKHMKGQDLPSATMVNGGGKSKEKSKATARVTVWLFKLTMCTNLKGSKP